MRWGSSREYRVDRACTRPPGKWPKWWPPTTGLLRWPLPDDPNSRTDTTTRWERWGASPPPLPPFRKERWWGASPPTFRKVDRLGGQHLEPPLSQHKPILASVAIGWIAWLAWRAGPHMAGAAGPAVWIIWPAANGVDAQPQITDMFSPRYLWARNELVPLLYNFLLCEVAGLDET
jgi:hypothetical protein